MPIWLPRPLSTQRGRQVSDVRARPAPTGGWNARDPRDQMRPEDAVELVNFFPRTGDVISRPGIVQHCDVGTGLPIARMFEFEYGNYHRLLAASNGLLLDVTSSSAAVVGGGYTSDYWTGATLSGRLLLANGTDPMQSYNGSTVSAAAFTGVSTDELSFVHVHKQRVYAIQRNSQTFWFGDPQAIGGALSDFDLSLVGSFGGDLMLLLTLTRDGGNGPDDFLVCVFSSGDCIVYQGSDPGDPEDWSQVGHFKVGRPLSKYAALEYGDDVVLLTERGYESVKVALPFGERAPRSKFLSSKIEKAVKAAVARCSVNDDWAVTNYAAREMLIVNVPTVDGERTEQHVMNTTTGAWCRFTGINATSWCNFGGNIFVGDITGKVHWFGGANNDNGENIRVTALTAWDYLDNRVRTKHHKMQRMLFASESMPQIRVAIGTDFKPVPPGNMITMQANVDRSYWDDAYWDESYFGADSDVVQGWVKCPARGRASSCRVSAYISEAELSWLGISYVFELGGIL